MSDCIDSSEFCPIKQVPCPIFVMRGSIKTEQFGESLVDTALNKASPSVTA